MSFDWFVLPFSIGSLILFILVIFKFSYWIRRLPRRDKILLNKGIFSRKFWPALWEIFTESLLHRRIFKINPVLGYMHMSFAFGWFMLIVIGNVESRLSAGTELNLPYYAIFFQYFEHGPLNIPFEKGFSFLMDFFLLLVLSGITIAIIKRIYSRIVGMRRTTKLKLFDRFAMFSLWFIFPFRLLAESFTAAQYHNGGFMTNGLGDFFAGFLPVQPLAEVSWWAYSFALGIFFVSLPYSRYMHIPSEIMLIAFRRFGIRRKKEYDIIKDTEIFSCSRCGICIDKCQLASMAGIPGVQSAYFIKSLRERKVREENAQTCLLCGRCQEYCPVGIYTDDLRLSQRYRFQNFQGSDYSYVRTDATSGTDVLYFAGCMTHLTPNIYRSMLRILEASGDRFRFMDEGGTICCGRPLMQAGSLEDARKLMRANKTIIEESGAHTLVTSCPICLRVFKNEYNLNIRVIHHSQYISGLLDQNRISLGNSGLKISYHDPCELGRGLDIFEEPRKILREAGTLLKNNTEKNAGLCCGGSLGLNVNYNQTREEISAAVFEQLTAKNPDILATACPLCKKTFALHQGTKIMDIAEIADRQMKVVPREVISPGGRTTEVII